MKLNGSKVIDMTSTLIKLSLILMLSIATLLTSPAQLYKVPLYQFRTAQDYTTHTANFVAAVDWLESTEPSKYPNIRSEANKFVMMWVSGSPNISVEVKQETVSFMQDTELFILYLGTYARYTLDKPQATKAETTLNAIEAVIRYYTRNRSELNKNKGVEKYIKMKENGTLATYVEKYA